MLHFNTTESVSLPAAGNVLTMCNFPLSSKRKIAKKKWRTQKTMSPCLTKGAAAVEMLAYYSCVHKDIHHPLYQYVLSSIIKS